MKTTMRWTALLTLAVAVPALGQPVAVSSNAEAGQQVSVSSNAAGRDANSIVSTWPLSARAAAQTMISRYGQPDSLTDDALTWNDRQPWSEVTLRKVGVKDDFPVTHVAFIDQTVRYNVPKDRDTEIERFDPALTVDKDAGTITSRSDSEAGNILALNIADEIARGRYDARTGRDKMRTIWRERLAGKSSPYTDHLMFRPSEGNVEPAPEPAGQRP